MMLMNNSTNTTGGLLLQTILYLSNFSDNSPNNTLEDFYHLPIGADTGNIEQKNFLAIFLSVIKILAEWFNKALAILIP